MQMISDLVKNIQIIAAAIVTILLIFGGIGLYLFKYKKKTVEEKDIDYSSFNRKDVMDYIKISDVSEDMLVADEGRRFISAIKCQGFSFGDAEVEEKLQTIRGYITFFNVLDNEPIQFRQAARDVNLDYLIRDYQDQITQLQEQRFTLNLDYMETKEESENPEISIDDYNVYYSKLKQMQRELISLGYQIEQLNAQVQYMIAISGQNAEAKREEIYVFDWHYHAVDFSSQKLEEQEVHERAEAQLKTKANAYISSLRNCGVHAKRMSGVEILEEIRRYTHPVSAAKDTVEDIVQSAFDSICVTSDSLKKLEEEANRKIVEEISQEVERKTRREKKHA
ncbi:MAG: hypothetical protein PHW34_09175 [Hespellia sp.]|nr:hypothetical protein [Hespellia sp.]